LQSGHNLAGIGSLLPEKFDDYTLIIIHPKCILMHFKVQTGKIIFWKSHNWIRFDLFNFPKGSDSRDMLTWKANSRTQPGMLAHVLIDQTIFNFPKGPHSWDMLTWKANPRTQRERLAYVLTYQTISRWYSSPKSSSPIERVNRSSWFEFSISCKWSVSNINCHGNVC
jgi:hypothetical protein